MTDPALIERITRSLAYMLRHQPHEFDLQLDAHGYGDVDEVVRALNERLGEAVERPDVEAAITAGDRPRYEIVGDKVRALYGHSIPVEPGEPGQPPELLYVGLGARDAERALQHGLSGGRRRFLHLARSVDDARESGRRAGREYAVLVVRATEAWEEGVNFYDRQALFLSEAIPTRFIGLHARYQDGEDRRDERGWSRPREDAPRREFDRDRDDRSGDRGDERRSDGHGDARGDRRGRRRRRGGRGRDGAHDSGRGELQRGFREDAPANEVEARDEAHEVAYESDAPRASNPERHDDRRDDEARRGSERAGFRNDSRGDSPRGPRRDDRDDARGGERRRERRTDAPHGAREERRERWQDAPRDDSRRDDRPRDDRPRDEDRREFRDDRHHERRDERPGERGNSRGSGHGGDRHSRDAGHGRGGDRGHETRPFERRREERPARAERSERHERGERFDRHERHDRPERHGRTEPAREHSASGARAAHPERARSDAPARPAPAAGEPTSFGLGIFGEPEGERKKSSPPREAPRAPAPAPSAPPPSARPSSDDDSGGFGAGL